MSQFASPLYQIRLISPAYTRGRNAARRDLIRVHGTFNVNEDLMTQMDDDFAAGYRAALQEFNDLPPFSQGTMLDALERAGF